MRAALPLRTGRGNESATQQRSFSILDVIPDEVALAFPRPARQPCPTPHRERQPLALTSPVPSQSARIINPNAAAALLLPVLAGSTKEQLAVVHLDAGQHILAITLCGEGTNDHVHAPLRTIIADALACNAVSLVMAHTHPSGAATPSAADRYLTRLIAKTVKPMGLCLQDHLIFAGGHWTSFRQLGLL
jgi:DNA repair protein RadC